MRNALVAAGVALVVVASPVGGVMGGGASIGRGVVGDPEESSSALDELQLPAATVRAEGGNDTSPPTSEEVAETKASNDLSGGVWWIVPTEPGQLGLAERLAAGGGATVLYRYPAALLVLLRFETTPRLPVGWSLIPLPDVRLIGHWRFRFDPLGPREGLPPGVAALPSSGPGLHLIQWVGPPQDVWLDELERLGVELVTFFPHSAHLVRLDPGLVEAIQRLEYVRWVGAWAPALKPDPEVVTWWGSDLDEVEVKVVVFNPTRNLDAATEVRLAILANDGSVVEEGLAGNHHVIRALVPSRALVAIGGLSDVIALEAYHPPVLDDESSDLIVNGQYTGEQGHRPPSPSYASWLATIGLAGNNTTVGVVDDGVSTAEVHLSGRVTNILSGATAGASGHGHHVAGIVAGSCAHPADLEGYLLGAGVAPAACILNQPYLRAGWSNTCGTSTSYGCLTRQTVTTMGTNGRTGTAQNNSWGSGTANPMTYSSMEREYDLRVRDANGTTTTVAEPLTICFSAGNSGTAGLTRPKSAKNIITTGASDNYRPDFNSGYAPGAGNGCPASGGALPDDNINMMVCFSSLGNCQDGRVKPDVVAPGANIASARAGSDALWGNIDTYHRWSSGTSQASPHTAGIAALITEWWRSGHGGADPAPALIKAVLINSAVELRTTTPPSSNTVYNVTTNLPNVYEGWGRVDVERHLEPGAVPTVYRNQDPADLFTGHPQTRTFGYTTVANAEPLYVTLVWTDAAGAVNANPALVNDLDLEVDFGGTTYRGNVLSTAAPTGKASVAGGTRDSINNVENIFLPSVSAGQTITVRVMATAVNGDGVPYNGDPTDQDFALVVYNASDCIPPAPPTGLEASIAVANQVDLSWTASATPGVTAYRVYRSTTPGGPHAFVGSPTPPTAITYADATVDGGQTYYYVVRAFEGCESGDSNEVQITPWGTCTTPPDFTGVESVDGLHGGQCGLRLDWSGATSNCGGTVIYNVYRSTTSGFAPGPTTRIASCVTDAFYEDTVGISGGTTYYYVVRAEDATVGNGGPCNDGNEDTNTVEVFGIATGGSIAVTVFADDFDGNQTPGDLWSFGYSFGNPYSSGSCSTLTFADDWYRPETGFCTGNAAASNDGFAPPGYSSPNNGALILGLEPSGGPPFTDGGILLPAAATLITMTFRHDYDFEGGATAWDGGRVMISVEDWPTFTQLSPVGGYPGTTFNTTDYCHPWPNTPAYVLDSPGCVTAAFDLTALAGQRVWLAWNHGADNYPTADNGWIIDDVLIEAEIPDTACSTPPNPLRFLTATSTSGQNQLEWMLPPGESQVRIAWRTDRFPESPTDYVGSDFQDQTDGTPADLYDTWTHSGLSDGTTYFYAGFVENTAGVYSAVHTVSGRPQDTTGTVPGSVTWVYNTGATALTPPGLGSLFGVSNDRVLHGMVSGATGGSWPRPGWAPMAMNAPAQGRPTVMEAAISGVETVVVGSQDGLVYAVDATTGAERWHSPASGDFGLVQATPSGIFTDYGGTVDLILVGTRNAGQDNTFYGISPLGSGHRDPAWSYSGEPGNRIGIVSGDAWVEYANPPRVYFASRERSAGSGTLWCLTFGGTSVSPCSGSWPVALGDIDGGPVVRAGMVYVGTNAGGVHAVHALNGGAPLWSYSTGDGPVKGYVWADWASDDLVLSTTEKVWSLQDATPRLRWSTDVAGRPSMPLVVGGQVVVGSTDGRLHRLGTSDGVEVGAPGWLLGAGGAAVGSPTYEVSTGLVYVGSESGSVYAVRLIGSGEEGP